MSDSSVVDLETYRRQAREWIQGNLKPRSEPQRLHEMDYYTPEVMAAGRAAQRRLFDAGYAGITYPKEYGGQGLTMAHEAAFLAEAADYELPDLGIVGGLTFGVCVPTMLRHASPEYLADCVPAALKGERLFCQFFSEPSGGSDLAGLRTRATRDGDVWRLNGSKIWSSGAQLADFGMCLARTNWDVPKHRGLTWFAVDCTSPGLEIHPIVRVDGAAEFCQEFFDDVVVPDSMRIGDVDGGWSITQNSMLAFERGAGRAIGDEGLAGPGPLAPDLVKLTQDAGRAGEDVARQKVARGHSIDFVASALEYRIARLGAQGNFNPQTAAYGKLFSGTWNPIRGRLGVEIGGASAITWDTSRGQTDATREYLNGRIASIAGGSNEMQRNGIGERALGLPREPSFDTNRPFSEVVRDSQWTGKV